MNLIKKFLTLSGALSLGASSTAIVVSCGPENNELQILLVPSNNPASLNETTDELEKLIHDELIKNGQNKDVVVQVAENYEAASEGLARGTTALAYIPILTYYKKSIENNANNMHQLFYSRRTALRAEYNSAAGQADSAEKLANMNQGGTLTDMSQDQGNVFNLVKESAPWNQKAQINTNANEGYFAEYYRGYQYVRKVNLKKYWDNADASLKDSWNNIVSLETGSTTRAVFNNTVATNPNSLLDYWKVVWNIYEQAAADGGIALATDTTSASGRIKPILGMVEAYLLAHELNVNDLNEQKKAEKIVLDLLNGHFVAEKSYNTDSLKELMSNRVSVGIGYADARTDYKSDTYTAEQLMDQLTVFNASHGIVNDGAVYSVRYFRNNKTLLHALQDSIVSLVDNNARAKEIFYNNYSQIGFVPIDIDDENVIKEYEKKIADSQTNSLVKIAFEISETIKPKGGSN